MFLNLIPKPYGCIAIAISVLAAGAYTHHRGFVTGKTAVQRQFDAYVAAQNEAVIKAVAANAAQEDAARRANDVQIAKYEARIAHADAYGRTLARRLRDATSGHGSGSVSESSGIGGTTGAGTQGGDNALTIAIGDTFSECRNNADQLDTLISEIKRQL